MPELMIVMGIMGILLYLAQRVVVSGYEFYRTTDESITLQKEGLLALTRITRDISASHHRSIVVNDQVPLPAPPPDPREDTLVIPQPSRQSDGATVVDRQGAAKWMSIVGYGIDTSKPNRPLVRYIADTYDVPGNTFFTTVPSIPPDPPEYIVNIELVTAMPTLADIQSFPSVQRRVAATNILSFEVDKKVDTIDLKLTIFLTGRVRGGVSLDNSLTLQTTVFSKN